MTQETVGFAALGIHPNVLAAIVAVGYEEPSPIQAQSIPLILEGAIPASALALLVLALFSGLERLLTPRGLRASSRS